MWQNTQIVDIEAALFEMLVDEVLVDTKHGSHSYFQLTCVTICLADGRRATGCTYTGGRGGIESFAISTVDIVLWDLRCKAAGLPLWQMADGAGNRCTAYADGIDLAFPLLKLCDHIEAYLAAGLNVVKIKVG